jgi:hypothetical protein
LCDLTWFSICHLIVTLNLPTLFCCRLSDGSFFTSFKSVHKRCFDGGFSNLVPVPPAPPPAFNSNATSAAAAGGVTASTLAAAESGGADAATAAAEAGTDVAAAGQLQPTGPVAALLRIDSTKGISTQLQTGRNNSSSSSRGSSHPHHLRIAGSAGHATHHKGRSSNGKHAGGVHSSSSDWAVLADHCVVAGEGAYVHAPGWFAVRVCVLPSEHLGSLPAMLRVSVRGWLQRWHAEQHVGLPLVC